MALVLAAAGHQGGPPGPGCGSALGREEGGSCAAGLRAGAEPAPPAGTEPALPQEPCSAEGLTARGPAESQTSQAGPRIAAPHTRQGGPRTSALLPVNPFSLNSDLRTAPPPTGTPSPGRSWKTVPDLGFDVAAPVCPPPQHVLMSCFKWRRTVKRNGHTSDSSSCSKARNAESKRITVKKVAQ